MKKYIFSRDGETVLRIEEAEPTDRDRCSMCGMDFVWLMENHPLCHGDREHFWYEYEPIPKITWRERISKWFKSK